MRTEIPAIVAACGLLLAGCAAQPATHNSVEIKALDRYDSTRSFTAAVRSWPESEWWTAYGDAQLDQLIHEALADSPGIASARARLQHAIAATEVQRSAGLPQISANSSITEQKQSYNYLTPPEITPQGWNDYGRTSLDLSWELDFWGKNRAALAAATSDAYAARAEAAQAALVLSTAVAAAYAELAHEYAQLDTAKSALMVRTRTADLFRKRLENGLETLGSVRQVEARRAAAESDVLLIEEQIGLQQNRIAALLGDGPDRGLAIARPVIDLNRPFGLPAQLSLELLGRRPDVVAARLRGDAAARRIKVARAAFYPNVNLTAFLGMQAFGLEMLTSHGSFTGSVGPAISLPIFNGGRLRGQLHGAEADYAEAVANYDRTVVQALQEVADAAVSQKALGAQTARTSDAVDAAREAWRIQTNRYEGGLSTYLEVLNAEDYLLANLRTLADLQARAFSLDVALIRALGGGYSINPSNQP